MATRHRTTFLTRLNRRYPWLKLVVSAAVVFVFALSTTLAHLAETPKNQSQAQNPDTSLKITLGGEEVTVSGLEQAISSAQAQTSAAEQRRQVQLAGKKLLALTFDDGPDADNTSSILAVLQEKDVRATFFMVGIMIQRTPETAKAVAAQGHEIASHSLAHQNLTELSEEALRQDLSSAADLIKSATGVAPKFLRPPYGAVNDALQQAAQLPLITWSVDPDDWQSRDPSAIADRVVASAHEGAIILLHDIYSATAVALPAIIDRLRAEGYEFATISELAKARGVELTPGAVFRSL